MFYSALCPGHCQFVNVACLRTFQQSNIDELGVAGVRTRLCYIIPRWLFRGCDHSLFGKGSFESKSGVDLQLVIVL